MTDVNGGGDVNGSGDVEVLGAFWTTAGPVVRNDRSVHSPFDWAQRCAEAQKAGLHGLGIWHTDLDHILESMSLQEIRQVFDDHGLRWMEVEFLNNFFVGPDDPLRPEADHRRAQLLEASAVLGAHHIKVGNLPQTPGELPAVTEAFAQLCAEAKERTDALITYELIPDDPIVPGVAAAVELVTGAGAANGGIAFDTWHLGKLGVTGEDLRVVPPEYLHYVELSDGMIANTMPLRTETGRFRRLPGEGEFDMRGYIAAFTELGYRGPWGVEVLSDELRAMPIEEMYRRSVSTTLSQFEPARSEAGR